MLPTCLSNYRSFSLLSVFHIKLLEKLMYDSKLIFWKTNEIFFDKQFGLRSKHHTDHAILSIYIVDKIQNSIEGQEYSLILERSLIQWNIINIVNENLEHSLQY